MAIDEKTFQFIGTENDADVEKLMTVIYHKTRLRLERDDPLLAMYYINCFMAGRLEASMREVMEEFIRRMNDVTEQVNADAVEKAENIVNGAITASENIVKAAIRDAAGAISEQGKLAVSDIQATRSGIDSSVGNMLAKSKVSHDALGKYANKCLIASAIAAAAAIVAVIVSVI